MIEDFEEDSSNPSREPSIGELISRRALLGGAFAAAALPGFGSTAKASDNGPSTFTFKEVPHGLDATHHVAEGYQVQVLIRWGDQCWRARRPTIR
jgi:secreted PhoX family phosphatase